MPYVSHSILVGDIPSDVKSIGIMDSQYRHIHNFMAHNSYTTRDQIKELLVPYVRHSILVGDTPSPEGYISQLAQTDFMATYVKDTKEKKTRGKDIYRTLQLYSMLLSIFSVTQH